MYTWAKVNTVQRAVVIISALGAQYGDSQLSGPQEGAEGLAEPIDISLSLSFSLGEECAGRFKVPQVHLFTIRDHPQGGSYSTSGKVFPVILDAHLWRSKAEALLGACGD